MRLKEFQSELWKNKISFAILYNIDSLNIDQIIFYFSGYQGIGALVIPTKSRQSLIVPEMEYNRAKTLKIKVCKWKKKTQLFETVKELILNTKVRGRVIGIDKTKFSVNAFSNLKKHFKKYRFVDISLILDDIRKIKTKEEIMIIKEGCIITDKILKDCLNDIKFNKLKTESDVASFLEYKANKFGGVSFPPIVASGKNASQPHYIPRNVRLNKGFCVIDFGIKYKGYCTDISRTVYLGTPSKKEIGLYNLLLDKQIRSIMDIKLNETGNDIYQRMVKDLGDYAKYFTHGLGHGIGVKIHELPNLSDSSKDKLAEDMFFTVEPGIYIPNKLGIRIEDDIWLTKKGKVVLTRTPKRLIIFK